MVSSLSSINSYGSERSLNLSDMANNSKMSKLLKIFEGKKVQESLISLRIGYCQKSLWMKKTDCIFIYFKLGRIAIQRCHETPVLFWMSMKTHRLSRRSEADQLIQSTPSNEHYFLKTELYFKWNTCTFQKTTSLQKCYFLQF